MNWGQFLMKALQAAPAVVQFVEQEHAAAPSATKKDMAMQSLGFAQGLSEFLMPQYKDAIDAASQTVSTTIDGLVNTFHAAGVFTSQKKGADPVPVATQAAAPAPLVEKEIIP